MTPNAVLIYCIDKDANFIVIEPKCTGDGGHMELQALRHTAMVSTMTFEKTVEVFCQYREVQGDTDEDAQTSLVEFLDWEEIDDELFAQGVRIVLASAEFSKEPTTSIMWLTEVPEHQRQII